jgi:hypothetical protein
MKSHLLTGLASEAIAKEALRALLPGQEEPWLLCSSSGDAIAYFSVGAKLDGEPNVHIQADISGRHYNSDSAVLEVLERVRASIGGVVVGDA